jgi:conjugal transfer pilus assembly protein TraB
MSSSVNPAADEAHPSGRNNAVRRRQTLLLAGGVGAVVIGTALAVSLSSSPPEKDKPTKPKTTQILAPGAQVDPRDAWRGQADAQLKAMEQRSRDLVQRNTELEQQSKEMLERLKKLESGPGGGSGSTANPASLAGLTPLPPPPVPAPALRPNFGPDRPGDAAQQVPLPPPLKTTNGSQMVSQGQGVQGLQGLPSSQRLGPGATGLAQAPTGIVTVVLEDGRGNGQGLQGRTASANQPTSQPRTGGAASPPTATPQTSTAPAGSDSQNTSNKTTSRDTRHYLPSGSFARALLLGGLDAPTGGQAQRDPQPVLLQLLDHAVLPNHFRGRVKSCMVVGAGYGDVSAERAYIRTEALSCITRDGTAIDVPVKGYVTGEDGKAGLRGRLVSKQGQILANALLAGVASGIGSAFQQNATTLSVSPLGSTSTVEPSKQLEAGLGTGVGKALDRLAQYYISLAEKVFPVIEVDAGRTVDVVITQGVSLSSPLNTSSTPGDPTPALSARSQRLQRSSLPTRLGSGSEEPTRNEADED